MQDLISRQAAIEWLTTEWDGMVTSVFDGIKRLPSVEPTIYGYNIKHLAYIAKVMQKEGVTAEYAVRTFDDMSRVVKMIIDEAQQKAEEALDKSFGHLQKTGGESKDSQK